MHTLLCDTQPTTLLTLTEGLHMSSVYPPFGNSPAHCCLHCGTPLPPQVVTCVNCGTYNPVAQSGMPHEQAQWGGSQPQAVPGSQYPGQQWWQSPDYAQL